jgi:NitT/TauT family transport system ATP-binding protein
MAHATERTPSGETRAAGGVAVDIQAVGRTFDGGVVAIDKLDLCIAAGEFVAVLGPSGCGKSTLLRLIAGLDRPTTGGVSLGEKGGESGDVREKMAYVFQDAHLLPWRNVLRNVALPLELRGVSKAERLASAQAAIERVGLADAARRYPAQLSGGMRMRASLARALVVNPKLLLLDEPFAALDELTRQGLDEQLRGLWESTGMTVLFVTHSVTEAVFLANRAVVLTPRPAGLVLDRAMALPEKRDLALRTSEPFMAEAKILYSALKEQK